MQAERTARGACMPQLLNYSSEAQKQNVP